MLGKLAPGLAVIVVMSSFGVPTLVERALRFSLRRAKSLSLAFLLAVSVTDSLLGKSLEEGPALSQVEIPSSLYFVIGAFLLVAIASGLAKVLLNEKTEYPYRKRESLFSAAELKFFRVLEDAVDPSQRVYGKVRLEDVIAVVGVSGKRRLASRGRIKSRHVDFVICDRESCRILAGVELDDRSHRRPQAKQVDAFKDRCFEAAGLPLLRFQVAANYSADALRIQISRCLTGDQLNPTSLDQVHLQVSALDI